jgi:uncharacterized protein YlxW (UPF0749 family)
MDKHDLSKRASVAAVTNFVRRAASGLCEASRKVSELAQATARGEVKLQMPVTRVEPVPQTRRSRLERELAEAKAAQATLHKKIHDLQTELNKLGL